VSGIETGRSLRADREEKLTVVRKLEDLVKPAIGDPDIIAAVYAKTVRFEEKILSPGGNEFAGSSVKAKDRGRRNDLRFVGPGVFRSMKDEDMIVRVDGYAGDLA